MNIIFSPRILTYLRTIKLREMSLIEKYNVPGPRYTSYPTVPFWKNDPLSVKDWTSTFTLNEELQDSKEISLYIHLPFCESLCTFCGCHKRITKNHSVEEPYVSALIKEWELYKKQFGFTPKIKELHFGGGTPTFFAANELIRLLEALFESDAVNPEEVELSFEAHPNNTSEEHLVKLYNFGFRRLSFGVQDYSPTVQKAINRIQPFETVEKVHNLAKKIGYSSISHDLVFGLPKQHLGDIDRTVDLTLQLMPDRISLYSYAHVPWIKGNGQRGFDESDLPDNEEKRQLYEEAKTRLEDAGYIEIGMDHFALPHDEMAIAFKNKKLHRNFMGYTTKSTHFLLGLGMSAISDSWYGFAQNDKSVESYVEKINLGIIPVFRGHILNELELEIRGYILDLMCHFETSFNSESNYQSLHEEIKDELAGMVEDGLVIIENNNVSVTPEGVPFVRNVCMAFDQDLKQNIQRTNLFSKTV